MNDMIVNAEVKSDDVQVKDAKAYELRPLVASDMGSICKIITAIGIRQFKECFDVDQLLEDQEARSLLSQQNIWIRPLSIKSLAASIMPMFS